MASFLLCWLQLHPQHSTADSERYQKALRPTQGRLREDWLAAHCRPHPEPQGFAPEPSMIQVPPAPGDLGLCGEQGTSLAGRGGPETGES